MEIEKREKDIVELIGRPLKRPSRNGDKEEEEDVGATIASTYDRSPVEKDDESHGDDWEDDREDTVLYNAKENEE